MQEKATFESVRLERIREKLQDYNFEIEYRKGEELIDADTISRQYMEEENKTVTVEDITGKNPPKLKKENGKYYWTTKLGTLKKDREVNNRKAILTKIHEEETAHSGIEGFYYATKKLSTGREWKKYQRNFNIMQKVYWL